MLEETYVILDLEAKDRAEALTALSDMLYDNGAVKDSFQKAVIEREEKYPTGLPASAFDIALPHTVGDHVNKPSIAVGILRHPVAFAQMGSPEITLHPEVVIMLAISDPNRQVEFLKKTMELLQNSERLIALKHASNMSEARSILQSSLE